MNYTAPRPAQRRPPGLRHRRPAVCAATVVLLLTGSTIRADAQIVRGRVIESATNTGLEAVSLTLLDERRDPRLSTTSDANGRFHLRLSQSGRYALRVELQGYRGFVAEAVIVGATEEVVLELHLATDEIVVAPITVLGRRQTGSTEDFEQRVRLMRLAGIGHTLTRADIERQGAFDITDLLAALPHVLVEGPPRARTVLFTTGSVLATCAPAIFVNAEPLAAPSIDHLATPEIVDAIELYTGFLEAPPEFPDPTGCGVVLVWTRPDPADARPVKWRRAIVYTLMTAVGALLFAR